MAALSSCLISVINRVGERRDGGRCVGAPMRDYTSDDEGLVSLAHIDGTRALKVLC